MSHRSEKNLCFFDAGDNSHTSTTWKHDSNKWSFSSHEVFRSGMFATYLLYGGKLNSISDLMFSLCSETRWRDAMQQKLCDFWKLPSSSPLLIMLQASHAHTQLNLWNIHIYTWWNWYDFHTHRYDWHGPHHDWCVRKWAQPSGQLSGSSSWPHFWEDFTWQLF